MRHRPKLKINLSKSLHLEMSGGGWAQQEHPDLFAKLNGNDYLTYEEVIEVRDGLDTAIIGMEGVQGGASLSFEEGRTLTAALRSGRALLVKLDAWLKTNS